MQESLGWLPHIIVMGTVVFFIIAFIAFISLYILYEFERGVVFTLGRFSKVKGPGLVFIFPGIQSMTKVDLRLIVLDVPTQEVISRDNVSLQVNAVLYFRVTDPEKAIIKVEDFFEATSQLAQTTLRSVLGQHELDVILAEREQLNASLQHILAEQTEAWGIQVTNVEIKQVDLNESMIRAIAKQAEAEREKRAKIIAAEGEFQSADKLGQASDIIAKHPIALQLRNLQVLSEIAVEKNSTIIFPNQFLSTVDDIKKFMASEDLLK